jgi:UDP-glucose 4-epimerase
MTIMLTGATGYLGSHLRRVLDLHGFEYRAVGATPVGRPQCSSRLDLLDATVEDLTFELRTNAATSVVHLAAVTRTRAAEADPSRCHELNVAATGRLLEACRRAGVGRFVFASTALVYGANDGALLGTDADCHPVGVYARSKFDAEQLVAAANSTTLRTVSLRLTSLFGPTVAGAFPHGVISSLVRSRRDSAPVTLQRADTESGTAVRDFLDVNDAAAAFVAVLRSPRQLAPSPVFNVATGSSRSLAAIDDEICLRLGRSDTTRFAAADTDPVPVLRPDASGFRATFGWEPRTPFTATLDRLLHLD